MKISIRKGYLKGLVPFLVIIGLSIYLINKEVRHAFKTVDKGLSQKIEQIEGSNSALSHFLVKDQRYTEDVQNIMKTSKEFNSFIDSTIQELIVQSGGWKENTNQSELANPNNYEVPTKILVDEGLGDDIEQLILETSVIYNKILQKHVLVDTISIPLKSNLETAKKPQQSWSEFCFSYMPLMALLPMLNKFKNDEAISRDLIYRSMVNKQNNQKK